MTDASDPPKAGQLPTRDSDDSESSVSSETSEVLETKRKRDKHVPDATDEAAFAARVTRLQEASEFAARYGMCDECMFLLARAVKSFEAKCGTKLALKELGGVLRDWWNLVPLPPDADFDEYLCNLEIAYRKARVPFGSNPLELAMSKAPPLTAAPKFRERIERLKAVCRHLQASSGSEPFFISLRDVSRVIGNSDRYAASNAMEHLVLHGVLTVTTKGKPGSPKATRYKFTIV